MSDEAVSKPEGSFAKPTAFLKPIRRPEKKPKENEVVVVGDKEVVETPSDIPEKNVEETPDYKEVPKEVTPELKYKEPKWSGPASFPYSLEVLKNGQIIEEIDISGSEVQTVGRLPSTNVPCLHPSISRYHAVFQHKSEDGDNKGAVFLYDLGSSYGTICNKVKLTPHTYYMLRTGYVIKFGASTRLYIVKGPPEEAFDDEEEMVPEPVPVAAPVKNNPKPVAVPKGVISSEEAEIFLAQIKEREALLEGKEEVEEQGGPGGISWGFREDAVEEEYMSIDVAKMAKPAEFKDPKKTLRGYFEREGLELEYNVTESGNGKNHQYICKVELPLDTANPVTAEGTSCGKKKDAVLACALHACQLLDGYNVLRSNHSTHVSKKVQLSKNDYYDEDEDTFTDRTGEVERKRKRRMVRAGVEGGEKKSKTFDMLTKDLVEVEVQIAKLNSIISASKVQTMDEDDLDSYMASVEANTAVDTAALKESKKRLYDLKLDKARLERLCQLAKPVAMPEVKRLAAMPSNICTGKIGKKQALKIPMNIAMKPTAPTPVSSTSVAAPLKFTPVPAGPSKPPKKIKMEIKNMFSKPVSEAEVPQPASDDVTEIPGGFGYEEEMKEDVTEEDPNREKVTPEPSEVEDIPSSSKTEEKLTEFVTKDETEFVNEPKPSESKTRRKRGKKAPAGATLTDDIKWDDSQEASPDFVNWVPPKNQSGDGRTSLNDKFGY